MAQIHLRISDAYNNNNNIWVVVAASGETVQLNDFLWTAMGLLSQGEECLAKLRPYDVCLPPCSNGIGAKNGCNCSEECVNCYWSDEEDY